MFPHQCLSHRLSLCCAETPCTEQHGLQPHCQPARARLFARCLTPGEPLAYCLAHLGLFMSIATTQLTSDKVGAAHVTRCACTINCHATLMRFTSIIMPMRLLPLCDVHSCAFGTGKLCLWHVTGSSHNRHASCTCAS